MMKKILVITYKFPPMGGIGSRRWVKFAKYFARKNYQVHVLTIKYPYKDKINWSRDVEGVENIIVHRLNAKYPVWYFKEKKYKISRIIGAIIKRIYNLFFNVIDKAEKWGEYMLPFAKEIILKEKINNLIVTAPFHSLSYYASILKTECPDINLILDYRDPWNDHRKYEYKKSFKKFSLKSKSVKMEFLSVNIADKIITNSNIMRKNLLKTYHLPENKVVVITNGFDMDDFTKIRTKSNYDKFNMIYTGELGIREGSRIEAVKLLAKAISELNDDFINQNLILNFFSDKNVEFFSGSPYFEVMKRNFNFNSFVSSDKIPELINEHFCCLSINAPNDRYAFGAKVFEYMALGKKIFHIANGGDLYDLLKKKKQYVTDYNVENFKKILLDLTDDFKNKKFGIVNYSEFDINKIIVGVEELLKSD
ncbi:MAG: glycosyltransferase [Ignavibacteriales bacterium]|nr:glycosyltransferase [Ignavibacteriales bacterium]